MRYDIDAWVSGDSQIHALRAQYTGKPRTDMLTKRQLQFSTSVLSLTAIDHWYHVFDRGSINLGNRVSFVEISTALATNIFIRREQRCGLSKPKHRQ